MRAISDEEASTNTPTENKVLPGAAARAAEMQDRAVAAETCLRAGAKMNPIKSAPEAAAAAACWGLRNPQILTTLPRAKSRIKPS